MARQLLGNIKGPRGEQGPQGPQGPESEIADINPNLLPTTVDQWVEGGMYANGNDNDNDKNDLRMKEFGKLIPGQTYTLSNDSLPVSKVNSVSLYQYDSDGTFIDRPANISVGFTRTFVATGSLYKVCFYNVGTDKVHPYFIESSDNRVNTKLELGSNATKNLNVLREIDKDIANLKNEIVTNNAHRHILYGYTIEKEETPIKFVANNDDTINFNNGFILDGGIYQINFSMRTSNTDDVIERNRYRVRFYIDGELYLSRISNFGQQNMDISFSLPVDSGVLTITSDIFTTDTVDESISLFTGSTDSKFSIIKLGGI